jgi:hypothetical protein
MWTQANGLLKAGFAPIHPLSKKASVVFAKKAIFVALRRDRGLLTA